MSDEPEGVQDTSPDDAALPAADPVDGPAPSAESAAALAGQARRVPEDKARAAAATGADDAVEVTGDHEDDDDAEGRETAAVGASRVVTTKAAGSPAGSARAAARAARAGTTPAKGVATKARDDHRDDKVNVFARLIRFLKEVVAELRKVIWPARNQMVTYTIVVIVFVVFMVALVAGLDVLFAKGVLAVFG